MRLESAYCASGEHTRCLGAFCDCDCHDIPIEEIPGQLTFGEDISEA